MAPPACRSTPRRRRRRPVARSGRREELMGTLVLLAFAAAIVAGSLAPLMQRIGFAVGAIDRPDARKVHAVAVSRLGGAAVWGAVLWTTILAAGAGLLDGEAFADVRVGWIPLALGAVLLAVTGIVDDVRGLGA